MAQPFVWRESLIILESRRTERLEQRMALYLDIHHHVEGLTADAVKGARITIGQRLCSFARILVAVARALDAFDRRRRFDPAPLAR